LARAHGKIVNGSKERLKISSDKLAFAQAVANSAYAKLSGLQCVAEEQQNLNEQLMVRTPNSLIGRAGTGGYSHM
jgi:hypothetical protein